MIYDKLRDLLPSGLRRYVLHFETQIETAVAQFAATLPPRARVLDGAGGRNTNILRGATLLRYHLAVGDAVGLFAPDAVGDLAAPGLCDGTLTRATALRCWSMSGAAARGSGNVAGGRGAGDCCWSRREWESISNRTIIFDPGMGSTICCGKRAFRRSRFVPWVGFSGCSRGGCLMRSSSFPDRWRSLQRFSSRRWRCCCRSSTGWIATEILHWGIYASRESRHVSFRVARDCGHARANFQACRR